MPQAAGLGGGRDSEAPEMAAGEPWQRGACGIPEGRCQGHSNSTRARPNSSSSLGSPLWAPALDPPPTRPPGPAHDTGRWPAPAWFTGPACAISGILSLDRAESFLLAQARPRPCTRMESPDRAPLPRSWLTCQCRSEAEGVVAVTAAIAGPVAADAWPPMTPTRGARVKHRVAHRALQQPAGVAPVQPLGPRWRRRGRGEGKSPAQACWDRCAARGGQSGIRYSPWYS